MLAASALPKTRTLLAAELQGREEELGKTKRVNLKLESGRKYNRIELAVERDVTEELGLPVRVRPVEEKSERIETEDKFFHGKGGRERRTWRAGEAWERRIWKKN